MKRILWVEDEPDFVKEEIRLLNSHEIEVDMAETAKEALGKAAVNGYDCIILDVMLGIDNGLELCQKLKKLSGAPVVFYSSLTEDEQQLDGLKRGGDDYILKGCSGELFLMKVNNCIKRNKREALRLIYPPLTIDLLERCVTIDGKEVAMTNQLFDILVYLAENKGKVCTRQDIFKEIWQQEDEGELQSVQVQISRLRRKLDEAFPRHSFIETVWGKGYYFQPYEVLDKQPKKKER